MKGKWKKLTSEHTGCFEWTFEVSNSWFTQDMNRNGFSVVDVLDTHECLDEEGLSKFEVYVHDTHHGDTHVGWAELSDGRKVVRVRMSGWEMEEQERTSLDVSERS